MCCGDAGGVAVELVNMGISSIYQKLGRLQSDRFRSDVQGPLRLLIAVCDKLREVKMQARALENVCYRRLREEVR